MMAEEGDRDRRLRRQATNASVAVAAALAAAKLGVWLLTGSVVILSSLLDSLVDLFASLVTMASVRHAMRPPDRAHRFGHGKAEALGALAQSAFVGGSALFIVFQAIDRLVDPRPLEATSWGIAVMVASIVLTTLLVVFQRHVIRVTGSLAIGADSLHYRGDLMVNLAVIATLAAVEATGAVWVDAVVAIAIAGYLLWSAIAIARHSLDALMDRELPAEERQRIAEIVTRHAAVAGLHDLRTRSSGTTRFIELHLELDGAMTLNAAHDVTDAVEAALREAFPAAEVIVHQEPAGLDDERLDRRIAGGRRAP
jgi:ferrous-iron efflux pump FieF